MRIKRRSIRAVLFDRRGIASSIPEALGGVSLKVITVAGSATVLAGVLAFAAVANASADTSSGFQNAGIGFEKAVHDSTLVVGVNTNRVGLLTDTSDGQCTVQTWQNGTRDGKTTLQVDTATVAGVCTPSTSLLAAGSTPLTRERSYNIDTPVFTYANLGGREITYDGSGAPTLTTGTAPAGVKDGDWNDVRPYKVVMTLHALDTSNAASTQNYVSTGYTNVVNVTPAADALRYVPAPSTDPIPGPVTINGVQRSTMTGTVVGGVHEGLSATFSGAVCPGGIPTKVNVSYTQQGPFAAPAVNTVLSQVLTGAATTVDLGQVPNGSTGAVEIDATCIDGGVVGSANTGFTQSLPATVLTVTQDAAPEKHDLSWVAVSSLPTSFALNWSVGSIINQPLTTTSLLSYQSVNTPGANLGLTTTYTIVATVDTTQSPVATAAITNPLPAPGTTTVTSTATGATWTAVTCPAYSTAQYAARYYQQTGTSTAVSWSSLSAWSTNLSLTGVTTPAYGRTVTEVHTRCAATVSGAISPEAISSTAVFYAPEAITISAARSATTGTAYSGAREGITGLHTGARCWNGSPTRIDMSWQPASPSGQATVNGSLTYVPTGSPESSDLAGVANGSSGSLVATATCTAGKSSSTTSTAAYTQPVPAPVVTVTQGSPANQHVVSWTAVSSLPSSFVVSWSDTQGHSGSLAPTTALTQTANQSVGQTYGIQFSYSVAATVNGATGTGGPTSITTPWPAAPKPGVINYIHTGGANYAWANITWVNTGSCPAGTSLYSQYTTNMAGTGVAGQIGPFAGGTTPWYANVTSIPWQPSNALQGWWYQWLISNKCSNSGSNSAVVSTQSTTGLTPMATPATPVWNAYNIYTYTSPIYWTHTTCNAPSGCASLAVNYITYCPAGASVNFSQWTSQDWGGSHYYHPFGFGDYWSTPGGSQQTVYYFNAYYQCATPYTTSPLSPSSGTTAVTVYP